MSNTHPITLPAPSLSVAADMPAGVMRLDFRSVADASPQWALVQPGQSSDWVVMIHGHGSRGDQLYTRPDLRDGWLPAIRRRGLGILTPDLRGNAWMSPEAARDMHALVGWLRQQYGARRLIFASGSMGGTSNLIYAALHPQDVSAVVALCPATDLPAYYGWCRSQSRGEDVLQRIADAIRSAYQGDPDEQPAAYARHSAVRHAVKLTMPIWMSHSAGDAVIPVSQARALVAAMTGRPQFAYVEIPGGHHDTTLARFEEGLTWVMERLTT